MSRKKVLIITSEPLNPADTYSSIFELGQARALQAEFDASILSVATATSLRSAIKGTFKQAISFRRARRRWPNLAGLSRSASGLMKCRQHCIESIRVFEGHQLRWSEPTTFSEALSSWIAGAWIAYKKYELDHGRPDVIHAHGRFLNAGAFALELFKSRGIPYVYTEHSSFFPRHCVPREAIEPLKEVIQNAKVFTVVSQFLADSMRDYMVLENCQPEIVPNLLNPLFEKTAFTAPPSDGAFTYAIIASLDHNKRIDLLIDALSQMKEPPPADWKLVICGDGPLRDSLNSKCRNLAIADRVQFTGRVPTEMVLDVINSAHVVVSCSDVETFGVAIIESLSRGRPVVATQSGGPNAIVDPSNGILVPKGDVGGLIRGMSNIFAGYAQFDLQRIRTTAIRNFGEETFLVRMRHIYDSTICAASCFYN